jgi:hypothetical protein
MTLSLLLEHQESLFCLGLLRAQDVSPASLANFLPLKEAQSLSENEEALVTTFEDLDQALGLVT